MMDMADFLNSTFNSSLQDENKPKKRKHSEKPPIRKNSSKYFDQRSPIQRSQLDFNNYLLMQDGVMMNPSTLAFLSDSNYYVQGITDEIFMMGQLGGDSLIILTRKGIVFVFVSGNWKKVELEDEFVVDFELSSINIILKTRLGNLYGACTYNSWNQTGTKTESSISNLKFELVEYNGEWLDVKTGYGHSFFLDYNREIFCCGNSGFGQFANNSTIDRSHSVTRIANSKLIGRKVKIIASGYANCLAIFEDGQGFVWGNNDMKQLGYAQENCITDPKPLIIPSKHEIIGLSAGQNVSLAMTAAHEIFVTGIFMGNSDVWRKVEIDFEPQSIFDAYVHINDVYILSNLEYAVFTRTNRKVVKIQSISGSNEINPHLFKYVVRGENILFYSSHMDIIPKHFIFKFNEKLNYSDLKIKCQMD